MSDFWNEVARELDAARNAGSAAESLTNLHAVRELVDAEINERMAESLISGNASIRSLAAVMQMSENSIGPRLAATSQLGAYARPDGRVTASGIERARYDRETSRKPMKFVPRKDR